MPTLKARSGYALANGSVRGRVADVAVDGAEAMVRRTELFERFAEGVACGLSEGESAGFTEIHEGLLLLSQASGGRQPPDGFACCVSADRRVVDASEDSRPPLAAQALIMAIAFFASSGENGLP